MIAVVDANVLASGARPGTVPYQVMERAVSGAYRLVLSDHILRSLARAWSKPYFRNRFPDETLLDVIQIIRTTAELVTPAADVHGVAEDEEDDLVLATAVAARADYLVTGDRYLLEIGAFRGIPIVTPRAFLDVLAEDAG